MSIITIIICTADSCYNRT